MNINILGCKHKGNIKKKLHGKKISVYVRF